MESVAARCPLRDGSRTTWLTGHSQHLDPSRANAMRIVLRWALTLILLLITAFGCFGFGASGEYKPDGLANPFRWLYGSTVVACVAAIVAVWRAKALRR